MEAVVPARLGVAAAALRGLPAYLVGVRCPLDVIMQWRDADGSSGTYAQTLPVGGVPDAVLRWQHAVHVPGVYDLEVDTSTSNPEECAAAIMARMKDGPGDAFARLPRPYDERCVGQAVVAEKSFWQHRRGSRPWTAARASVDSILARSSGQRVRTATFRVGQPSTS